VQRAARAATLALGIQFVGDGQSVGIQLDDGV
jgi:hypothetical protein